MKKHFITLLAFGALASGAGSALAGTTAPAANPADLALDQAADPALLPDAAAPTDVQAAAGPKLKFKIKGVNAEDEGDDGEGDDGHHGDGQGEGEDDAG